MIALQPRKFTIYSAKLLSFVVVFCCFCIALVWRTFDTFVFCFFVVLLKEKKSKVVKHLFFWEKRDIFSIRFDINMISITPLHFNLACFYIQIVNKNHIYPGGVVSLLLEILGYLLKHFQIFFECYIQKQKHIFGHLVFLKII